MHIYLAASRYRKFSPVANLTSVNNCYIYIHFFVGGRGGGGGGWGGGGGGGGCGGEGWVVEMSKLRIMPMVSFFLKAKYIYINQ